MKKNLKITLAVLLMIAMITPVFGLGQREEIVDPTVEHETEGDIEGVITTRDDRVEKAQEESVERDELVHYPDGEVTTRDDIFKQSLDKDSDQ